MATARTRTDAPPTLVLLGVGGLGCPAALSLVENAGRHGLALRLVLVDPDRVDRSNLARQILFREADIGAPKAEMAARRLRELVPEARVEVRAVVDRFHEGNARTLLDGASILLDGTDDPLTRFLANDTACAARIPLVHGAAIGWTGQVLTVIPRRTACLRCLFEGPPRGAMPTCAEAGVASPLCGVVGALMAGAALEVLGGGSPASEGVLRRIDGRSGTERPLPIPRDPECAACSR